MDKLFNTDVAAVLRGGNCKRIEKIYHSAASTAVGEGTRDTIPCLPLSQIVLLPKENAPNLGLPRNSDTTFVSNP